MNDTEASLERSRIAVQLVDILLRASEYAEKTEWPEEDSSCHSRKAKKNPKIIKIYGLYDPRTKLLRYVGLTKKKLAMRLSGHWSIRDKQRGQTTRKINWLKDLEREGLRPTIKLLERVGVDDAFERETFWIEQSRQQGCDLVNA